jgi:hypothetical protein
MTPVRRPRTSALRDSAERPPDGDREEDHRAADEDPGLDELERPEAAYRLEGVDEAVSGAGWVGPRSRSLAGGREAGVDRVPEASTSRWLQIQSPIPVRGLGALMGS